MDSEERREYPSALEETEGISAENAAIPMAVLEGDLLWGEVPHTTLEHYGDSLKSWSTLVSNLHCSLSLAKDQRVLTNLVHHEISCISIREVLQVVRSNPTGMYEVMGARPTQIFCL